MSAEDAMGTALRKLIDDYIAVERLWQQSGGGVAVATCDCRFAWCDRRSS